MTHTTNEQLIAMYQDRVEKAALEKLRWEKEKAEYERQIEHLKALNHLEIHEQEEHLRQLASLEQEHQTYQEETQKQLDKKDRTIEALNREVIMLRRRVWGKSSERYIPEDPRQRKIEFEGLEMTHEETELLEEAQKEVKAYKENQTKAKAKTTTKPTRLKLLPHLRREVIYQEDPCDITKGEWVCIGEKVTEVLAYNPAEIYVKQYIRKVWALKGNDFKVDDQEDQSIPKGVVVAPYPNLPIKKSNAHASILAGLLVGKYVDHLPFYRQLEIFKRSSVSIPASTVNDWMKYTCDMLRALYHRLQEVVLATDYIQVDESTIPIVDKEKSKTVKGYLWLVRSVMEKTQFFFYDQGSRAQRVAIGLLKDYRGILQTDGYQAYSIFDKKEGVILLNCWAHARRYWDACLKEDKVKAEYALTQIGMLYDIERMADDQDMSFEERAELRTRLAYPIMVGFEKWLYKHLEETQNKPKGRLYKALHYNYTLFYRLSRYHLDGRMKLDNNEAENAIRPLAIGRKNYLFCQNHDAAENAAVVYSLLGCCKSAGVNPQEWLTDVLEQLPRYNADYSLDLADLLPHNWIKKK